MTDHGGKSLAVQGRFVFEFVDPLFQQRRRFRMLVMFGLRKFAKIVHFPLQGYDLFLGLQFVYFLFGRSFTITAQRHGIVLVVCK